MDEEKKISDEQIKEVFKKNANKAKKIIEDQDAFSKFIEQVEIKAKEVVKGNIKLEQLIDDISLFIDLCKSYIQGKYKEIPTTSIIAIVSALLYFMSPIDLIPDFIPVLGLVDDAAIILFAIKLTESDIENYKQWKANQ